VIEVSPALDDLIACACDPNPVLRFPTARVMAEAVEAIGRESGTLATHVQVSDYIERLVGSDLIQRRELVAQRIANGERASMSGPELVAVPEGVSAPLPLISKRPEPEPAHDSSGPIVVGIPGERRPYKLALGVGAVLVLGAAGALAWQAISKDDVVAPTGLASRPTGASQPLDTAASTAPLVTPQSQPIASTTASALGATPPQKPKSPAKPTSKKPDTKPPAAPATPGTSKGGGPIKAPEGISTANPYRR
jgi:hypothetical protein